jgi:hypothetical protein
MKRIAGFLISLICVLGINFIPLEMFLYRDFSAESAMIFYSLENLLAIAFTVVFIVIFGGKREINPGIDTDAEFVRQNGTFSVERLRRLSDTLKFYLLFSLAFGGGGFIFLIAFVLVALKKTIQFDQIEAGLIWIAGFLVLEFFGDLLMFRPLTVAKTELFLKRSMGRIALLFLSVFVGFFLALFVDWWYFIPFVALKTLADISEIVQIFKSGRTA